MPTIEITVDHVTEVEAADMADHDDVLEVEADMAGHDDDDETEVEPETVEAELEEVEEPS